MDAGLRRLHRYLNDRIEAGDPEVIAYDDYFPVMQDAVEWDGNIIGLPFAPYFVLQHYNTEYFDTLGLKPATTFTEMLANAKAANKREPSRTSTAPSSTTWPAARSARRSSSTSTTTRAASPSRACTPARAGLLCGHDAAVLQPAGHRDRGLLQGMLPYQPEGALNFAWTERQTYFNTGLIAFNSQWNVTTPSADDPESSTIVGNVGTAPFPHDSADLVTQVGGWSMAINKCAVDPEMSWDYLQWFTSPQVNVEFAKLGGFPARQSTLDNADLNAQYPWYATLKEVIPTAFADCRPRNNESFNIINTLGTYISKAMSGEMTTEEAMKAADAEIGRMLKEAGYNVTLP